MKENVAAYLNFRYEKIRLLKENSKSAVWLALNKSTNQPVIMKIINSVGLPYAALKENSPPFVAKIFYCAESPADTVVVEEFLAGETLSGKTLTDSQARKILLQLCECLKVLHALGIIHRDIKPSNLILQTGGDIRLIDFDAARIFKFGQGEDTKYLGTKGYAPPEQFGFGQTDARSDIFSLGKTFLELTGENCGSQLQKILSKCVEVDPKNRYQNVDEIKTALTKKSFRVQKICATIAVAVAGLLAFFNSTNSKNIPTENKVPAAEIKTPTENKIPALEIETPAENKIPALEIETPAENKIPALEIETPTENKIPALEIETPTENKIPALEIETPAENKIPALEIETPTENKIPALEIETPTENKIPALEISPPVENEPAPIPGLENFQPSFPTIQNYNFELKMYTQNLGGVKLGDSLETARAILGREENIHRYDNPNFAIYNFKNLNLAIENNLVTAISTTNAETATLKGVRQGDTLQKVLAAYGNHYQTRQLGNLEVYIYPYDLAESVNQSFSAELRFAVENNAVQAITLMAID